MPYNAASYTLLVRLGMHNVEEIQRRKCLSYIIVAVHSSNTFVLVTLLERRWETVKFSPSLQVSLDSLRHNRVRSDLGIVRSYPYDSCAFKDLV